MCHHGNRIAIKRMVLLLVPVFGTGACDTTKASPICPQGCSPAAVAAMPSTKQNLLRLGVKNSCFINPSGVLAFALIDVVHTPDTGGRDLVAPNPREESVLFSLSGPPYPDSDCDLAFFRFTDVAQRGSVLASDLSQTHGRLHSVTPTRAVVEFWYQEPATLTLDVAQRRITYAGRGAHAEGRGEAECS